MDEKALGCGSAIAIKDLAAPHLGELAQGSAEQRCVTPFEPIEGWWICRLSRNCLLEQVQIRFDAKRQRLLALKCSTALCSLGDCRSTARW